MKPIRLAVVLTLLLCATASAASAPKPLPRPATAVTVKTGSLQWHVRDSFVQYLASGEGTSGSKGAVAQPASVQPGSDAKLVYGYRLALVSGWYDAASGKADLTFRGTVRFRYRAHGIDLAVSGLEVQLTGKSSKVVVDVRDTGKPATRGVLAALDPSKAERGSGGAGLSLTDIPASITKASGDSVFAGYYLPGDPFGTFSVTTA